jgi:drug/metabolite transporter (DMT)-like permease
VQRCPGNDWNLLHRHRHQRPTAAPTVLQVYPAWFLGYFVFMLALSYTSVTSASIMYTTLSLFSYLLSIALLVRPRSPTACKQR